MTTPISEYQILREEMITEYLDEQRAHIQKELSTYEQRYKDTQQKYASSLLHVGQMKIYYARLQAQTAIRISNEAKEQGVKMTNDTIDRLTLLDEDVVYMQNNLFEQETDLAQARIELEILEKQFKLYSLILSPTRS